MANHSPAVVLIAPCLVFLGCAYFTRTPAARVGAALLSSIATGTLNVLADVLGHHQGWWWYPAMGARSVGPLEWYAAAGIGVAGLTLIGWRVHRRYGLLGLTVFLMGLAAFGTTRDWAVSTADPTLIQFGAGAIPWIADFAAWFACATAAVAVQTLLRGQPNRDTPRDRANSRPR
jgi:hypothetical protein